MSAGATQYDAYYKAMGGVQGNGQLVDAYEGMNIENQRRRMTDEFDDSPQGDSMMSPPLEPIESFEPRADSGLDAMAVETSTSDFNEPHEPYRLGGEDYKMRHSDELYEPEEPVLKSKKKSKESSSEDSSESSSSSSSNSSDSDDNVISSGEEDSKNQNSKSKASIGQVPEYITKLYVKEETLKSFIESPDASKVIEVLKVAIYG